VELAITKIDLPGPPSFTGYLRDITDRNRANDELRASRARLVEVADAERRRIQRNLHDGAQQRLTAVLLVLGRLRDATSDGTPPLDTAIADVPPAPGGRPAARRGACIRACSPSAPSPPRSRRSRFEPPCPSTSTSCPTVI